MVHNLFRPRANNRYRKTFDGQNSATTHLTFFEYNNSLQLPARQNLYEVDVCSKTYEGRHEEKGTHNRPTSPICTYTCTSILQQYSAMAAAEFLQLMSLLVMLNVCS